MDESKTPEELAYEYVESVNPVILNCDCCGDSYSYSQIEDSYLAGYKAAQARQELFNDLLKAQAVEQFKAEAGANAAGNESFNKIMGENRAWDAIRGMSADAGDTGEMTNPNDPRYKVTQDKLALAEKLRKEIPSRTEFAKFGEVSDRFNVLKLALSDPSRVSDQDFVVGIAKILDPGSVVREFMDQLADAGKVINSPEKLDGWISTKQKFPPVKTDVLWWNKTALQCGVSYWKYAPHNDNIVIEWGKAGYLKTEHFSYWQPLPEPPKDNG